MADKRGKMPRPVAVSDLLAFVFHGKPAEKRLKEGKIWLVWDRAVGKQIAARARPVSFRDGVLTVAVANAPWMQQLNFLKKGIMEKLNAQVGEELVLEIYLKAGRNEPPSAPVQQRERTLRPLSREEKLCIAEQSAAIEDQELREAFASLLAKHLGNREAGTGIRDSGTGNRDSGTGIREPGSG